MKSLVTIGPISPGHRKTLFTESTLKQICAFWDGIDAQIASRDDLSPFSMSTLCVLSRLCCYPSFKTNQRSNNLKPFISVTDFLDILSLKPDQFSTYQMLKMTPSNFLQFKRFTCDSFSFDKELCVFFRRGPDVDAYYFGSEYITRNDLVSFSNLVFLFQGHPNPCLLPPNIGKVSITWPCLIGFPQIYTDTVGYGALGHFPKISTTLFRAETPKSTTVTYGNLSPLYSCSFTARSHDDLPFISPIIFQRLTYANDLLIELPPDPIKIHFNFDASPKDFLLHDFNPSSYAGSPTYDKTVKEVRSFSTPSKMTVMLRSPMDIKLFFPFSTADIITVDSPAPYSIAPLPKAPVTPSSPSSFPSAKPSLSSLGPLPVLNLGIPSTSVSTVISGPPSTSVHPPHPKFAFAFTFVRPHTSRSSRSSRSSASVISSYLRPLPRVSKKRLSYKKRRSPKKHRKRHNRIRIL